MAIVRAVKSGNWSDPTVWNTGELPTSADDVYSNTFTVTVDQSVTVLSLRNSATTGVTAGGGFTASANGLTIDVSAGAGIVGGSVNPSTCFTYTGTVGNTLNITGNCTGGSSNAWGANNASTGTLSITGNVTGGSSNGANGVNNTSSGTLNITGNCTGGSNINTFGANNASTGTLVHVGAAQASTATAAIGTGAAGQITILTGPLISSDGSGGTAAASGINPCVALRWFPADTALSTFEYRMRGATVSGSPSVRPARQLFLTDAYSATYPAASNVRSATTYGPGDIYTGTCAVPPAGSVALGVPVDNTTGTAAIDGASIRSALGMASANLDTQLAAIPSVSDIAAAVWAAATRTLTTAIDNSATIAAAVWSSATRTITGGTVDTLTNAPTVSTPSEIASQVRTELSTELGRIDANISSRPTASTIATAVWGNDTRTLTSAIDQSEWVAEAVWSSESRTITGGTVDTVTNSTPIDAGEIAEAVRTELTPELARVANCATTQEVGDIVEGALDNTP